MFVRTYPVLCRPGNGSVSDYLRETERQLKDSLYYGVETGEGIAFCPYCGRLSCCKSLLTEKSFSIIVNSTVTAIPKRS